VSGHIASAQPILFREGHTTLAAAKAGVLITGQTGKGKTSGRPVVSEGSPELQLQSTHDRNPHPMKTKFALLAIGIVIGLAIAPVPLRPSFVYVTNDVSDISR